MRRVSTVQMMTPGKALVAFQEERGGKSKEDALVRGPARLVRWCSWAVSGGGGLRWR